MNNVVVDYGVAYDVYFDVYITANPEARATAFTPAANDVKISSDGGATFAGTTNTATFANGILKCSLTATEMQAARLIAKFEDQDAALVNDSFVEIYTKNNASAFYSGIDLNTDASGNVTLAAVTHTGAVIPTVTTNTDMRGTDNAALASDLTTAQNDLDIITGADGAALASTQQSITFQPITITAGDAIANITLAGSGTEDGIKWTRSGSGDPLDANFMAQINAEVVDVLKTDTISEMAQGAPTATPTFEEAVMYLYMALRNKVDVTATTKEFHNDAGTVTWKKALSDDGTTYSEAEGVSGP